MDKPYVILVDENDHETGALEKPDNNLWEHELDHVFVGISDVLPLVNQSEVLEWRAVPFQEIERKMRSNPASFTAWFRHIYLHVNTFFTNVNNE